MTRRQTRDRIRERFSNNLFDLMMFQVQHGSLDRRGTDIKTGNFHRNIVAETTWQREGVAVSIVRICELKNWKKLVNHGFGAHSDHQHLLAQPPSMNGIQICRRERFATVELLPHASRPTCADGVLVLHQFVQVLAFNDLQIREFNILKRAAQNW